VKPEPYNVRAADGAAGGFGGGVNTIPTENDAANEVECKRANLFIDGLSLYFEEHDNELLSKSGAKSVGTMLLEMRDNANTSD
jgi:hypothetical protein